jgi:putative protease
MKKVEIVAPAGNLASLKAAIDAGADVVYAGFSDSTNARNFEGLNFTEKDLALGREYAGSRGRKLYLAVNTFPQAGGAEAWRTAVDRAFALGADAVILADMGVLRYARERHPDANIHLSVQASASNHESINFYKRHFNIRRVVLPRVLTVGEISALGQKTDVELEVFALGGLCINIEGRCYLSSFVTGASTNTEGVCSPTRFVEFENDPGGRLSISLNKVILNRLGLGETAPYPTCCKGRYMTADGAKVYAIESPESLDALEMLPGLIEAGISALKIEGRQRTKSYVSAMTGVLREAVDSYYRAPAKYRVEPAWAKKTIAAFEGSSRTLGSYAGK